MSDRTQKFEKNVPGRYYVGRECIGCTLCAEIAPNNFRINSDENLLTEHGYVWKQCENTEEEALCAEAQETCPSNAIGDDGI